MESLLTGSLSKDHYKLKDNSKKNNSEVCCVGEYDKKMKLNNKWSLKK